MISFGVAVVAALISVLLARTVSRHLPPVAAVVVMTTTAVGATVAWLWEVMLLASFLVGRIPLVAAVGRWSGTGLAAHDGVPGPVCQADVRHLP